MNTVKEFETLTRLGYELKDLKLVVSKIVSSYENIFEVTPTGKEKFLSRIKTSEERIPTCSFQLKEISPAKLKEKRDNKVPSFVLKQDGVLYYTEIKRSFNLVGTSLTGEHKCSHCEKLSAAPDEKGCPKVRRHSIGIEKFPWIKDGYETFSTKTDAFVVTKCDQFEPYTEKQKKSSSEIDRLKLGLAQYIHEDAQSLQEVMERMKKRKIYS